MGNQIIGDPSINQNWYEQGSMEFRIPGIPKLVFNPTLQRYADKYQVQFPNRSAFLAQCQIFKKRSGMFSSNLVQVIATSEIDTNKQNKGSGQIRTQILTQRINWRLFLQPLASITIVEGWYLLSGILNGIEQLCELFKRSFLISQKMVGINSAGVVKIWCNKNFASNKCEESNQTYNIKNILFEIVSLINKYVERGYFEPFKKRFLQMDIVSFYQFKFQLGQFLKSQQLILNHEIGVKLVEKGYKKNCFPQNPIFYPPQKFNQNVVNNKKIKFSKSPDRFYHKKSETCLSPQTLTKNSKHEDQFTNPASSRIAQQVTFRPYIIENSKSLYEQNIVKKCFSPAQKKSKDENQSPIRFIFNKEKKVQQKPIEKKKFFKNNFQRPNTGYEKIKTPVFNLYKKQTFVSRYHDSQQEIPIHQYTPFEKSKITKNTEIKESHFKHSRKYRSGDIQYNKFSHFEDEKNKKLSHDNSPIKSLREEKFVANIHKQGTIGKFIKQKLKSQQNQNSEWSSPISHQNKINHQINFDTSQQDLDPLRLSNKQLQIMQQIRNKMSVFHNNSSNKRNKKQSILQNMQQRRFEEKLFVKQASFHIPQVNKQFKKQSGKMTIVFNSQPSFQCPKRRRRTILQDISEEKQNIISEGLVQIPLQVPEISRIKGHTILFKGQNEGSVTKRQEKNSKQFY